MSKPGKVLKEKRDEFYTQMRDIEKEMRHYRHQFKDKVVFCNCDDPEESNFWQFFSLNFKKLGLKKLVSTHFRSDRKTYKLEISRDLNGDGNIDWRDKEKIELKGNGDFRSPESIELLEQADIIVTNPPFSLFGDFLRLMEEHDKKFLVVGPGASQIYHFSSFKGGDIWSGVNSVPTFEIPEEYYHSKITSNVFIGDDGKYYAKFGNISWFTNLDYKKRHESMILYRTYKGNEDEYPTYDNHEAISINKLKDIPMDYEGLMGCLCRFLGSMIQHSLRS